LDYTIKITDSALVDIQEHVEYLQREKGPPKAIERWFRGVVAAIYSLENMLRRCPLIPESDEFSDELRHHLYGSHRIIFRVIEETKVVEVLRVYHGAREPLNTGDIG
jgi:plasmid stabilization system protein ParE